MIALLVITLVVVTIVIVSLALLGTALVVAARSTVRRLSAQGSGPRPRRLSTVSPTTAAERRVRDMTVGATGFLDTDAVAADLDGRMWIVATAVVHPVGSPRRLVVKRDDVGYHVRRTDGLIRLRDVVGEDPRPQVLVVSLFD